MLRLIRASLRKQVIRIGLFIANTLGFWRYPSNRDKANDPADRLAELNWIYKSQNPLIRAEKGSGLENYFLEKQQIDRPFLPEGFQTDSIARLSAVGDLMRARGLGNSKGKLYKSTSDLIFHADVSFANLESTVIEIDENEVGTHVWVTCDEYDAFKGHNDRQYTVFSTANNHIIDGGVKGMNSVHGLLDTEGFNYVGTNSVPERQRQGLIIDSNGIRFGFVAATYGINHKVLPTDKGYLVNIIPFTRDKEETDLSLLNEQIEWCRSQGCDFVIASLHWGHEFEFFPRLYQVQLAHKIIEQGADALIGHHSHTIQPYEIYQTRRDPHRKAPIFYSLGNLVSWSTEAYRCLSLISRMCVVKGHIGGATKTLLAELDITPVQQIEYETDNKSFLQLHALGELVRTAPDESTRLVAGEAAPFADLVLGRHWRENCHIHHS